MKQNERIILEAEGERKIAVYYRNILYVRSEGHYLYYYLKNHDNPIKIRKKISDIEGIMEKHDFVRMHRIYEKSANEAYTMYLREAL